MQGASPVRQLGGSAGLPNNTPGAYPCPTAVHRHCSAAAIHPRQRRGSWPVAPLEVPVDGSTSTTGQLSTPAAALAEPAEPDPQEPQSAERGSSSSSCAVPTNIEEAVRELELERQRTRGLEAQIRELIECVEKLRCQAENELQKSAVAEERAADAEEQQARFTEELDRERRRAGRLEDQFAELMSSVEQLTRIAREAQQQKPFAEASFEDADESELDMLKARIRDLERQAEDAGRRDHAADIRFQAKEAECAKIRQELQAVCAERAELDSLQAEHNGRMEQYLGKMIEENDRRSEALSLREARIEELGEEQCSWVSRQKELELQVESMKEENKALTSRVGAAEARSETLARDKERLTAEVMKAMAALAEQKRDLESKLSLSFQCTGTPAPASAGTGAVRSRLVAEISPEANSSGSAGRGSPAVAVPAVSVSPLPTAQVAAQSPSPQVSAPGALQEPRTPPPLSPRRLDTAVGEDSLAPTQPISAGIVVAAAAPTACSPGPPTASAAAAPAAARRAPQATREGAQAVSMARWMQKADADAMHWRGPRGAAALQVAEQRTQLPAPAGGNISGAATTGASPGGL
eukprot:gnl/TRDRNA2_/TRDRNA2_171119_c0_seq1.p1 gnl/TRDRNA2_/TRDRNA2_171119_c0~~gnl/TRDRNA2_/TRDRNA2_171119_c0_seq1.p1  ORF type:complete len:582 (-),score=131.27 gnl/TRDRNA2_/TRDRNA2_171119_c0_seq1:218-1963(-)